MPPSVKIQRSWFLALFGLPFFGFGAWFLLFSIVPALYDAARMTSWEETPGTLLQARLISSSSSKSTSYRVDAEYRYSVDGRDYRGNRVDIGSGSDNIGDYQQELGNRLKRAYENGQPVSVWYDPENPNDAVLVRDLRFGLLGFQSIFVILFGGIGGAMLYFGLHGVKTADALPSDGRPWLQRSEWQGGVIRSGEKAGMYFAWGFAVFWNLISIPAAFAVPDVWREKGAVALLVLIFPCVGLGLLIWAVKTTLEWRRFGSTPMTMDPFPGAIGGDVGGEIEVNTPYDPSVVYEVTLSCINSYESGSGDDRSRKENVIWQDSGYANVTPAMRGVRLQFRFEVPDGLPASEAHSGNYHLWRLNVHGDMPGVDLKRSFEIPVYIGTEKSRHISILSPQYHPAGGSEIAVETLLPLARIGSRIDIYYPMLRNPLAALGMLLFGAIFNGSGVFLWRQAELEGFPLYLMGGIFNFVGGLVVLAGFYALFNSLRVQFDGRSVSAVRRVLGIPVSSKTVDYPMVHSVESKQNGSSQSGNSHHINYQVIAKTASGELVLAEGLDSHSKAKRAAEYFAKLMRVGE